MMTRTEAAEAVIAVLNDKGWCQFPKLPGDDSVCAGLAFREVMAGVHSLNSYLRNNEPELRQLWVDLENWVKANGFDTVPRWNDASSTTEEDVKLTIKRLAGD